MRSKTLRTSRPSANPQLTTLNASPERTPTHHANYASLRPRAPFPGRDERRQSMPPMEIELAQASLNSDAGS